MLFPYLYVRMFVSRSSEFFVLFYTFFFIFYFLLSMCYSFLMNIKDMKFLFHPFFFMKDFSYLTVLRWYTRRNKPNQTREKIRLFKISVNASGKSTDVFLEQCDHYVWRNAPFCPVFIKFQWCCYRFFRTESF